MKPLWQRARIHIDDMGECWLRIEKPLPVRVHLVCDVNGGPTAYDTEEEASDPTYATNLRNGFTKLRVAAKDTELLPRFGGPGYEKVVIMDIRKWRSKGLHLSDRTAGAGVADNPCAEEVR